MVRQGIANLHRPRNQTVAVTLALGFGVFLLSTLYLVQVNLLDAFRLETAEERPNLLLFDIQRDQADGLAELVAGRGTALRDLTPIVPARIAAINGRTASELMADTTDASPSRWTLRREYRNTYRAEVAETERVVAGEWWGGESALPRISLEADLADDLRVGIGDRITWDVQGVPIETTVANLREVDWMRFAPNFFVVFEPGVLEAAPHSLIALARVPDARARAELQRDIVEGFPNISALDLAVVQEAVDNVIGQVTLAIRFLALFSIAGGLVVLVGAVSTSRVQRAREAALLRTLGATGQQIRRILLTEYAALGALAGMVGTASRPLAGGRSYVALRAGIPGARRDAPHRLGGNRCLDDGGGGAEWARGAPEGAARGVAGGWGIGYIRQPKQNPCNHRRSVLSTHCNAVHSPPMWHRTLTP